MKKSNILITTWIAILVATGITVYLAFIGLVTDPFRDLLYVIEGAVIVELSVIELSKRLNEPIILIEPHCKMEKVGFSVKVKDKNISDATVLCDGMQVKWEELDGTEVPSKNLHVGGIPSFLYPFWLELGKFGSVDDSNQYVPISILQKYIIWGANFTEVEYRLVYDGTLTLPRGAFKLTGGTTNAEKQFDTNIRICGEGIEEELNRFFEVHFEPLFERDIDSDRLEDITLIEIRMRIAEIRSFWRKKRILSQIEEPHAYMRLKPPQKLRKVSEKCNLDQNNPNPQKSFYDK